MDKVTHFLFLVALVLFIVMALMWMMGGACAAGYVSTHHQLPPWIQDYYNDLVDGAKDAADLAGQHYRQARSELSDIADAAKQFKEDRKREIQSRVSEHM